MTNPSTPSRITPDDETTPPLITSPRSPQFMPIPVYDTEETNPSEDESDPSEDEVEPEEPQPLTTVPEPTGSVNIIRPEPVSLSQIHPSNRSKYARKSVRQPQRVTISEQTVTASMQMSGRKRNRVPDLFQSWRNEEQFHSTPEIGGPSNTAPTTTYTQEPLHHIDPVLRTRIEQYGQRLRYLEYNRENLPSTAVEQLQHQLTEAHNDIAHLRQTIVSMKDDMVDANEEIADQNLKLERNERRTVDAERRAMEAERRAVEAEQRANILEQRMTAMEHSLERVGTLGNTITQMAEAVTRIDQIDRRRQ